MSTYLPESESTSDQSVVAISQAMKQVVGLCERVADSSTPVLLVGPRGTEFPAIAAYLHAVSGRSDQPFVRQRCVSWQDFTKPLKLVASGTLYLEGIELASRAIQLRLLDELEEARLIDQAGSNTRPPRIIVSTSVDLQALSLSGQFIDDLYWQLCPLTIPIPPLRDRVEDIPEIVRKLLGQFFNAQASDRHLVVSPQTMQRLQAYDWPGNYRELHSQVARSMLLTDDGTLQFDCKASDTAEPVHSPTSGTLASPISVSTAASVNGNVSVKTGDLSEMIQAVVRQGIKEADKALREPYGFIVNRVEQALIAAILSECDNVQTKAAARLGINRNTLHKKIKEYGLE